MFKSRARISLLGAAVLFVVLLLWMWSLASWRPTKLAVLSGRGDIVYFDAKERFLVRTFQLSADEQQFERVDLQSGRTQSWRQLSDDAVGVAGPFQWSVAKSDSALRRVQLRNLETGTQHQFLWKSVSPQTLSARGLESRLDVPTRGFLSDGGRTFSLVNDFSLQQWDVASGRAKSRVALGPSTPAGTLIWGDFALSNDGKRLFKCSLTGRPTWDAQNGTLLAWRKMPRGLTVSTCVCPDNGRVSIVIDNGGVWHFFDSATGKFLWKFYKPRSDFEAQTLGDEVAVQLEKSCEMRDLVSGRVVRRLSGPRLVDGEIVRSTPDSIYTLTPKNEIYRWRAR